MFKSDTLTPTKPEGTQNSLGDTAVQSENISVLERPVPSTEISMNAAAEPSVPQITTQTEPANTRSRDRSAGRAGISNRSDAAKSKPKGRTRRVRKGGHTKPKRASKHSANAPAAADEPIEETLAEERTPTELPVAGPAPLEPQQLTDIPRESSPQCSEGAIRSTASSTTMSDKDCCDVSRTYCIVFRVANLSSVDTASPLTGEAGSKACYIFNHWRRGGI